jgi:hypothetical protein
VSSTAVVAIEGVLARSPQFGVAMLPNDDALRLYAGLVQTYRVILVTCEPEVTKVEHWLRSHGLRDHDQLLTGDGRDCIDVRASQLRALRASRTAVALVVDSEPLVVAHAASVGLSGLLYVAPRSAPSRADMGARRIRDWSAIEAELDLQREIRTQA